MRSLVLPIIAATLFAAALPVAPAPPAPEAGPAPRGFFRLAYCGPARQDDPANQLRTFQWDEAARGFDLTIIQNTANDYRRFVQSLVRQNPEHRVLYYVHAHGLYPSEDRAGLLNLTESNYVHATDPASLRVIPTAEGLLVDWERDERLFYDEADVISEMRDFTLSGYVVYRATGDGEFARIWPELPAADEDGASADSTGMPPVDVTQFLDRTAEAGTRYRYLVRTLGPVSHEYTFSSAVAAVAGTLPAVPFVHEQQFALEAKPGAGSYTGRFRVRVGTPATRAVLRIDMNADHDFADPGELFSMQPSTEDFVEAIVPLDPRAHTDYDLITVFGFAYRLEFESPAGRLVLPEVGAYTTSVNNRVRSAHYGFYLMSMDSADWIDHVERELELNARRDGMVRGVFLDELLFDPAIGVDAMPADLDQEQVVSAASALVRALASARPDLAVYMNGLDGLTPALAPDAGGVSGEARLAPGALAMLDSLAQAGLTGGMIEGFALAPWHGVRGGTPGFAAPRAWLAQQVVAEAAAARGREVLCLARAPAAGDVRARLFAFASYLLVSGPGVRFGYMADRCRAEPLPEWAVDLGAPGETLAASGSNMRGREFERGEVWVNPDPEARVPIGVRPGMLRLALADTALGAGRVEWEPAKGSLVLGPQSALILLREAKQGVKP